jgi:hypothetical protein
MEINDALSYLNPSKNDIIKGLSSFAMYDIRLGWIGSLDYLEPNKGYMYFANMPDTLIYPNEGLLSLNAANSAKVRSFKINQANAVNKYPYNMSVVAALPDSSIIIPSDGDMLTATCKSELLGTTTPKYVSSSGQHLFFLSMANNQEQKIIKLRYYSKFANQTFDLIYTLGFNPNERVGTIESPLLLKVSGISTKDGAGEKSCIYPNPCKNQLHIAAYNKKSGDIRVCIYDALSKPIYIATYSNMPEGWNYLQWNGVSSNNEKVKPGIYMVNLKTESENITTRLVYE